MLLRVVVSVFFRLLSLAKDGFCRFTNHIGRALSEALCKGLMIGAAASLKHHFYHRLPVSIIPWRVNS